MILFFAGHGTNKNEGSFAFDHILFADNQSVYVHDWAQEVRDKIKPDPSTKGDLTIIGFYDACRNGVKSKFSGMMPSSINTDDVRYFPFFSCRPGEESNENVDSEPKFAVDYNGDRFRNGFFTYSLLSGMDQLKRPEELTIPNLLQRASGVMGDLMKLAESP